MPGVPKLSLPGLAFKWARSCWMVLTGSEGCTSRKTSTRAAAATGVRSLTGSNGILGYRCGLTDTMPPELMSKV